MLHICRFMKHALQPSLAQPDHVIPRRHLSCQRAGHIAATTAVLSTAGHWGSDTGMLMQTAEAHLHALVLKRQVLERVHLAAERLQVIHAEASFALQLLQHNMAPEQHKMSIWHHTLNTVAQQANKPVGSQAQSEVSTPAHLP